MVLAEPVSAATFTLTISDRTGDVNKNYDWATGQPKSGWGDNMPIVRAGYFDVVQVTLSQTSKIYTFEMKLAANLPAAGDPLPPGVSLALWDMWIESDGPWNPINPQPMHSIISLMYDGVTYSASVLDITSMTTTPLSFSLDGPRLQIVFSTDSIGGWTTFWWSFGDVVWHGWGGYSNPDNPDPGASPGQVYWDFPWPPI